MAMITRNDAEALIDEQVSREIIEGVTKASAALSTFRKLPNMTSDKTKMRILDALPLAYWVDNSTSNGRKNVTKMAWANKYINAAEIAVIVPIKEEVLDDASYDIWGEVKPRIVEAFHKKIDAAIFTGDDKPDAWRADLLSSIINAGAVITPAGGETLYSTINSAMVKVEESGYNVTAVLGGPEIKGKFRMMLDTTGQPIAGTEIGDLRRITVDNGAWDKSLSQMIVGDFSQAVYAIRQDITYKVLSEAVIQDPTDGSIMYNLAQEDMVALRVVMRLGWEIPNPINALSPDEGTRFPFASIYPTSTPSYNSVTFTVTDTPEDEDDSPAPVQGVKIRCGQNVKTTNSSGQAVFKFPDGTYDWKATKSGATAQEGKVVVDGNESVSITNFG